MSECIPALALDSTFVFPAVCFDVTQLRSGLWALSPEAPTCQHVSAWTLNCLHILMYFYCDCRRNVLPATHWCITEDCLCHVWWLSSLNVHWILTYVEWRCMTDNMETWTWWTALTLLLEYRLHDDSQRLSCRYRITISTLPYFGNLLYLLSPALSILLNLSVTAASKTNYTITS